jgi:hypothetical protein
MRRIHGEGCADLANACLSPRRIISRSFTFFRLQSEEFMVNGKFRILDWILYKNKCTLLKQAIA